MTADSSFLKDPSAVLDYAFDWKAATNVTAGADGDWLASGETISTATITVSPTGTGALSAGAPSLISGATAVQVWLSAGIADVTYTVTCAITTNQSRTEKRSIHVTVRSR